MTFDITSSILTNYKITSSFAIASNPSSYYRLIKTSNNQVVKMAMSQAALVADYMGSITKHWFGFWKVNAEKVCDDEEDIKGKILAKRGAVVIMAVRDLEKGQVALDDIKKTLSPLEVQLELMKLDLGDLQSIKDFVKDFESKYSHLNILVNNAGFMDTNGKLLKTKDGFEQHVGVNHLGPFLLTRLLINSLKKGAPSRLVCVSSSNVAIATLDLDDLMMEKKVKTGDHGMEPYSISKLTNAICIKKFAETLEPDSGIKVIQLCPGFVKSDVFRNVKGVMNKIRNAVSLAFVGLTPHQGSETAVYCCVSKSVVAEPNEGKGDFYRFLKRWERGDKLLADYVKSEQGETLYRLSEEWIGLRDKNSRFKMPRSPFSRGMNYISDKTGHRFWSENATKVCDDEDDITGKIVIITGSNSGVGKEVAFQLAKRGAVVIMGVRDVQKGKLAVEDIKKSFPSSTIDLMTIDLGDLNSIKSFVAEFQSKYSHLDILVNNAGIMIVTKRSVTKDGFEENMAVNHFGTFLLTKLLLSSLTKGAPSRVVTLASTNLAIASLDLEDLMMEKRRKTGDNGREQYNSSKLAIAVCTRKLVSSLDPNCGIKFFLMCPGYVKTALFRDNGCCRKCLTNFGLCLGGINAHKGSETAVYLCLSKSVASGENSGKAEVYRFMKLWQFGENVLKEWDGTEQVEKLYAMTENLLGLHDTKSIAISKSVVVEAED
ncbi:Retinol dehydrogenase 11 [Orchesella cincta]|uniref:Retinol dehydrogenase 11 n=1 Tax=Orchesella cincta TaxID=48709 RepID=A0A1D2N7F8_ORCCI|nr:Retinol dehydrogenase 11 [Orchesella cincta]